MHRPAIYAALPTLKEKGLISERQVAKRILYAAEPPTKLRALLKPVHEELDAIIPELTKLQENNKPTVRKLDGKQGIHTVYEDILTTLKKGDEFYRYSSESSKQLEKTGLPKGYEKRRDELGLERMVISNPDYVSSREPSLEESLKVVPDEFLPFDDDVSQIIYGDKIAFIDYKQQVSTIIENPTLAKFQKDIFKMLYRRL
jgi:sugar-specific transcriptional regulator TrmB